MRATSNRTLRRPCDSHNRRALPGTTSRRGGASAVATKLLGQTGCTLAVLRWRRSRRCPGRCGPPRRRLRRRALPWCPRAPRTSRSPCPSAKRVGHKACRRFWKRLAPACDRGHTHPVGPRANGEVYEYLVGSPAFKAGDASDPRMAGSIPVHLRHTQNLFRWANVFSWGQTPTEQSRPDMFWVRRPLQVILTKAAAANRVR